jgi:CRP-like cAMP-binding protein
VDEALQRVPLFSALKGKQLKRVAEAMTERTFVAGEEITKEGEVGVGFYVIQEGHARVTMNELTVGELGPGDHFGEISLIAETPRAATVTAETDMRCQGMTSWDFRKLVEGNGEIAWAVLASTARKLYENAERERARALLG